MLAVLVTCFSVAGSPDNCAEEHPFVPDGVIVIDHCTPGQFWQQRAEDARMSAVLCSKWGPGPVIDTRPRNAQGVLLDPNQPEPHE